MKEFSSINELLDYWIFCPLCKNRLCVSIRFDPPAPHPIDIQISYLETIYNNQFIKAHSAENKEIFLIDLIKNSIHYDKSVFGPYPFILLNCKKMHFGLEYNIEDINNQISEIELKHLRIFFGNKNKRYYIRSDYEAKKTELLLSDGIKECPEMISDLLTINSFNINYLKRLFKIASLLH